MLGSFRVRLLMVIVIVAVVGFLWQFSDNTRHAIEPVIRYITDTDYDIQKIAQGLKSNLSRSDEQQTVPVTATNTLQIPCQVLGIDRNYGWYYDPDSQKQEFCSGIYLKVKDNTLVKPIMKGQVEKISGKGQERSVLIRHADNLYSLYGGLKEVLVEKNEIIDIDKSLGKTGENLYLEIRNQDGPLNPQSIFDQ